MTTLCLTNALLWDGEQYCEGEIYVEHGYIAQSKPKDCITIDLDNHILLHALTNHHDHLELNHYPRTKFRDVYENAHQWGEDVNQRLDTEPFATLRNYPLRDKLFIGALKNLLSGALTVVQHGKPFSELFRKDFPVTVVKDYGWAHSLHFDTPEQIQQSYHSTPKTNHWYIHLAEGTDDIAQAEYQQLKALGCVGNNTVLIHGAGLGEVDLRDFAETTKHQGTIIICPTTNYYLLNAMLDVELAGKFGGDILIGSDSRLTADGDLLDEYTFLKKPLTRRIISCGDIADLIVVPKDISIERQEIALIIRNGNVIIGNESMMTSTDSIACELDGTPKRLTQSLAKQIHRCKLKEQGLIVDTIVRKRFWIF